uniref:Endonuclease/exonuclease/phosphatase domain-containing protein n=1 Tax=Scylla olivacea TaxID=85551 RepID=A0A0P4VP62_SCYOL
MEALFFRVVINDSTGLLLCVMYRPPRQGRSALDFLTEELDTMLQRHKCSHVMILGDLNFHLEQDAFNSLLMVQGLTNHVSFPTHERGGSLDPVLTDLPDSSIVCHQLGTVGTSDHHAVLARVKLDIAREAAAPRTIWLWEQADWASLRHDIVRLDWDALLIGNAEEKATCNYPLQYNQTSLPSPATRQVRSSPTIFLPDPLKKKSVRIISQIKQRAS